MWQTGHDVPRSPAGNPVSISLLAQTARCTLDRADADGTQFLTSHLPIVNVFYLRLLSHWLVLDRLNEMADPGYLQRHQDSIRERSGQEFWLPPTQYAGM